MQRIEFMQTFGGYKIKTMQVATGQRYGVVVTAFVPGGGTAEATAI